jgi:hypothetical protein
VALYTFFLRRADGDATSFEAHDLPGDADAARHAAGVHAQHPSAAYVEVFHGDREVLTLSSASS